MILFELTLGEKYIHIIDFSDVTKPSIIYKQPSNGEVGDVELCGSKVAFSLDGNPGSVAIYNVYDKDSGAFNLNTTVEGKNMHFRRIIFYVYIRAYRQGFYIFVGGTKRQSDMKWIPMKG